jgi:hypothetical protein
MDVDRDMDRVLWLGILWIDTFSAMAFGAWFI